MAYDETLAERIRDLLAENSEVEEKKMFGGIAFLVSGKMGVGVSGDSLMVRIGKERHQDALGRPGVREFDMTGRPMTGWVLVDPGAVATDADLRSWVDQGVEHARSLGSAK